MVSGAVLHSARLSAKITVAELAAAADADTATVRSWEDGSQSLASVAAPQLQQLEVALRVRGAEPRLVADIAVAAWCDLTIAAIAEHEDPTVFLADPLAADPAFRELLTWSIDGQPPESHRPYATAGPLVPAWDTALLTGIAQVIDLLPGPARQSRPGGQR